MNRFLIGQYGSFDDKKYERDFRDGFYGIEACLFSVPEDIDKLVGESKRRGFQIGIHFPLRAGFSRLRDALFLSPDVEVRTGAYAYIENELAHLSASVKPAYVLFHYPKPVILDDRVNWEKWRFYDSAEYMYESEYSLEEAAAKSEELFQWLTEKSGQYGFVPVLEFDALNRYVYESDFLESLLVRYPAIKLCLDTGRLFFQEKLDPHFRAKEVIRKYAKYAATIHLWTLQVDEERELRHYHFPVLPELDPADGWAPIEDYLHIIAEENDRVRIMFEHRSDLIDDEQLERCYAWVAGIFDKPAGK
ncbi:sugar phosphate isomerase/epimerase [Brevibacillus borstelensis]|uniref:sugar phosphate isomerase/epimerase n=1 Tax=Brevibacillus borstelensis TaxID=45462 RepID=UPI0030C29E90